MKMCMPHWQQLQQAIKDKGMWHLVYADGSTAMEIEVNKLQNIPEDRYDPLMAANWSLFSAALEQGGLYLMGQKEDGTEYCPLCECDEHTKNTPTPEGFSTMSAFWIHGCTESILVYCRERGLVPKVS